MEIEFGFLDRLTRFLEEHKNEIGRVWEAPEMQDLLCVMTLKFAGLSGMEPATVTDAMNWVITAHIVGQMRGRAEAGLQGMLQEEETGDVEGG